MDVDLLKFSRLLKTIQNYRGGGTSFITLLIPGTTKVSDVSNMITSELSSASNVKSRVNRQSVISCLTSCQQKLKLYKTFPQNGLMILSGEVSNGEDFSTRGGKKITLDIEPPRPIVNFKYKCDNKFHIDELYGLLKEDTKYGFIVVTGDSFLFATVQGGSKEILYSDDKINLPKKHNKGGQSSVRFSRLREEARTNYMSKVTELATKFFISENALNVKGLILAGFADFKLILSERLDPRIKRGILKIVDISYGMEQGLNQAIELSKDTLNGVKLIGEKKIISEFMNEIANPSNKGDGNKYCFGVEQTMKMLEEGLVAKLIVWEEIPYNRVVEKVGDGKEEQVPRERGIAENKKKVVKYVKCENKSGENKADGNLLEYILDNYRSDNIEIFVVSDKTPEGSQFCKGFMIGGILRYSVAVDNYDEEIVTEQQKNEDDDGDFI